MTLVVKNKPIIEGAVMVARIHRYAWLHAFIGTHVKVNNKYRNGNIGSDDVKSIFDFSHSSVPVCMNATIINIGSEKLDRNNQNSVNINNKYQDGTIGSHVKVVHM